MVYLSSHPSRLGVWQLCWLYITCWPLAHATYNQYVFMLHVTLSVLHCTCCKCRYFDVCICCLLHLALCPVLYLHLYQQYIASIETCCIVHADLCRFYQNCWLCYFMFLMFFFIAMFQSGSCFVEEIIGFDFIVIARKHSRSRSGDRSRDRHRSESRETSRRRSRRCDDDDDKKRHQRSSSHKRKRSRSRYMYADLCCNYDY